MGIHCGAVISLIVSVAGYVPSRISLLVLSNNSPITGTVVMDSVKNRSISLLL